MLQVEKIYVIHTKSGLDYRRKHIEEEMSKHHIDYEFMLDGDISDLSPAILDKYFTGWIKNDRNARTSCALKHIYVLEKVVNSSFKNVLILEDDAILHEDFTNIFNKTILETINRLDINQDLVYIDYDNSTLEYIPEHLRKENQFLYKKSKNRGGGAYFLTYELAKLLLSHILENKCDDSNDILYNKLLKKFNVPIYWSHPPLVEQASNNGKWESSLGNQPHGFRRKIRFGLHKFFNKHIYYKWFKK